MPFTFKNQEKSMVSLQNLRLPITSSIEEKSSLLIASKHLLMCF